MSEGFLLFFDMTLIFLDCISKKTISHSHRPRILKISGTFGSGSVNPLLSDKEVFQKHLRIAHERSHQYVKINHRKSN